MWYLGGCVFGVKVWFVDYVMFFNCKVFGFLIGNVELWNFIVKCIEGICMNICIIYGEKGCKV